MFLSIPNYITHREVSQAYLYPNEGMDYLLQQYYQTMHISFVDEVMKSMVTRPTDKH